MRTRRSVYLSILLVAAFSLLYFYILIFGFHDSVESGSFWNFEIGASKEQVFAEFERQKLSQLEQEHLVGTPWVHLIRMESGEHAGAPFVQGMDLLATDDYWQIYRNKPSWLPLSSPSLAGETLQFYFADDKLTEIHYVRFFIG